LLYDDALHAVIALERERGGVGEGMVGIRVFAFDEV
jgi:hypothetical protein